MVPLTLLLEIASLLAYRPDRQTETEGKLNMDEIDRSGVPDLPVGMICLSCDSNSCEKSKSIS
jgi:hypothetical protein